MTPSDLPEQGDPADGRQWTLHGGEWIGEGRDRYFRLPTIEPRPPLGATIPVVPLERAHRAEEAARDFAAALDLIVMTGEITERVLARDALARHPGFLPNYPGENG